MRMRSKIGSIFFSTIALLNILNVDVAKAENKVATPPASTTVTDDKAKQEYVNINYLKIDGIPGYSDQEGFKDYIQVNSWSTGISTYDKVTNVQEFYVTLPKSNTSVGLFKALVNSSVIPTVTLVVLDPATVRTSNPITFKNNPKIIFKFVMRNVSISNFQMGGYDSISPNTKYPLLDQVSFRYESGTYEGGDFDKDKKALPENSVKFTVPGRGLNP